MPPKHIVLFIILSLYFTEKCLAKRLPIISDITKTQIKDIGETADLSCSVKYGSDYQVLWLKSNPRSNRIAISIGNLLIIHESRYSLRVDRDSSTYRLQIKNLTEADAGVYQCQIVADSSIPISAEAELQVGRLPFFFNNSTKSIVVSEGEAAKMECYAGGYPTPRISWRRENNATLPSGGSIYRGNKLKIKKIRKEDKGTYYCIAKNGIGRGAKRNIAVEVQFAPVVTVPRPLVRQPLQNNTYFGCNVKASPPPALTWMKDGVVLSNNQDYSISNFATDDYTTYTTFGVNSIEKGHYGQYVCKATNKLGSAEGRVDLVETSVAVRPLASDLDAEEDAANSSTSTATTL